jgi:hypothetical protein
MLDTLHRPLASYRSMNNKQTNIIEIIIATTSSLSESSREFASGAYGYSEVVLRSRALSISC